MSNQEKANQGSNIFCGLICGSVLGYFYYTFAYNNPDLINNNYLNCLSTNLEGEEVNVTMQFLTYFELSFYLSCAYVGNSIFAILANHIQSKGLGTLAHIFNGLIHTFTIPLLVMGSFWRFSETGQYCSGKYGLE